MTTSLEWDGGSVTAEWDGPTNARAVLVLAHGAGGDLKDPILRATAAGLAAERLRVLRFNFPYREAGRRTPGSQNASEACYRSVAEAARVSGVPLLCGGRSYGGRIASHIAADGFDLDALVFLSYPLHPPGNPDRLRTEHLGRIGVPMLFCQGTRDSFATPELLRREVALLPRAELHEIEGAEHSLRARGRKQSEIVDELVERIAKFVGSALKAGRR